MRSTPKIPTIHLVAAVALAGCGDSLTDPGTTPDPDPAVTKASYASIGDTVTLELGASAIFEPAGVEVTFLRLVGDSRCPVGVTCVWEGDAEVEVRVATGESGSQVRLHTSLEPRAVSIGAYVVQLVDVLPHPIDDPLADPGPLGIVVTVIGPTSGS